MRLTCLTYMDGCETVTMYALFVGVLYIKT